MLHAVKKKKKVTAHSSLHAVRQLYLHFVMHQGGDYYGNQAEGDEAVLHVLHHRRQDNQVCVEGSEDGPVYVAALRRK